MNLGMSDRVEALGAQVRTMIADEIEPLDHEYHGETGKAGDRFVLTARQIEIIDGLKAKARTRGLWNFC